MSKTIIKLTALKKAVDSLKKAISQPMLNDEKLGEFIRDAIIQRFEFTYELSWKLLKRYLEKDQNFQITSVKQIYREAGRLGLIDNVESWFVYQEARNLTSHIYDEDTSNETLEIAKRFAIDVEKLLHKFEDVLSVNKG